jgi:hypothetical protein
MVIAYVLSAAIAPVLVCQKPWEFKVDECKLQRKQLEHLVIV